MISDDDDLAEFEGKHQRRVKLVAWIVIAALILTGGGATVFALLFG